MRSVNSMLGMRAFCPIESFAEFSADGLQAVVALSDRTLLVLTLKPVAAEKLDVLSGLRIMYLF